MKRLIRGRLKKSHLVLLFLTCVLLYSEFFIYHLNEFKWHRLRCHHGESCTKLLLVADPQIIGNLNEIMHFLTPLSIWDSDRYLSLTYQRVFNFVQPDVVIFLGDLFDEGSISSQYDFIQYVKRFHKIFNTERNSSVKYIFLPGDNDIGGEGGDFVTAKKTDKFNQAFLQPDNVQYNEITFYSINRLVEYIPGITESNELSDRSRTRIALSHIPILYTYSKFADQVMEELDPHVLFTAHEHKSKLITYNPKDKDGKNIEMIPKNSPNCFRFTLKEDFTYEFMVPTCSYRMGTADMGFGFGIVEGDDLQYTVLWSPSRFPTLIFYCVLLVVFVTMLCFKLLSRVIRVESTRRPQVLI